MLLSQNITNPVVGNTLKGLQTGDSSQFLNVFIPKVIGLLFIVGALGFFFMLLWGAIAWILSGGDKAGIESAKGKLTNATIGVILLLSTFALVKIIELFFGVNILSIDIGPLIIQ